MICLGVQRSMICNINVCLGWSVFQRVNNDQTYDAQNLSLGRPGWVCSTFLTFAPKSQVHLIHESFLMHTMRRSTKCSHPDPVLSPSVPQSVLFRRCRRFPLFRSVTLPTPPPLPGRSPSLASAGGGDSCPTSQCVSAGGGGRRPRMPLRHLLVAGAVPVSAELDRDARCRPLVHQLLRWDSIITTVFGHVQTVANESISRDGSRDKDVGRWRLELACAWHFGLRCPWKWGQWPHFHGHLNPSVRRSVVCSRPCLVSMGTLKPPYSRSVVWSRLRCPSKHP